MIFLKLTLATLFYYPGVGATACLLLFGLCIYLMLRNTWREENRKSAFLTTIVTVFFLGAFGILAWYVHVTIDRPETGSRAVMPLE